MAGRVSRSPHDASRKIDTQNGFRRLGLFSEEETFEVDDMFSGGSDIMLHGAPQAFATVQRAEVGDIGICRVRSSGHDVEVREPHALTLIVPFSGSITVEDHFGCTTARPGGALLAPPGKRKTRVEGSGYEPFLGVPLLIPVSSIRNSLQVSGLDRTIALNGSRSILHAEAIRLVTFLHDEMRNGAGLIKRPRAEASHAALVKDVMVDLLGQLGKDSVPRNHDVSGNVTARRVRAAEDFMIANLAEILTIADVARELGISVRTLELAFRSVHDVSPHQYLTSLRLAMSRHLLLADPGTLSVTEACLACGIGHTGRFAAAYRKRFGETPGQTLRRR